MALPVVVLSGSPHEQGFLHGTLLRDQIHHNLEVYFHRFMYDSGLERTEVLRRARLYAPKISEQNNAYFQGMQGIAEGSGTALDEIVALNVRYEIIYYQSVVRALGRCMEGCTAFAVRPKASSSGHLIIGQNWDWIPGVKGAVLHTADADGLCTLAFTEAGIFGGKIGFNSAGLGLAVNGLTSTADDWTRMSKPFHLRCYEVLRQRRIEDAVAALAEARRGSSANFLIAQIPDNVIDVETAPDGFRRIVCDSEVMVHTNHFVDSDEIGAVEPPSERTAFSRQRQERMEALLMSEGRITREAIKCYLQNHEGAPSSICRHEDLEAPVADQYRTVTSIIVDLHERTMLFSDGPPCQGYYDSAGLH